MDSRRRPRDTLRSAVSAAPRDEGSSSDDAILMGDTTESHVIESDDALTAYGGTFYLQEDYLQRLRQQFRGPREGKDSIDGNFSTPTNTNNTNFNTDAELFIFAHHQPRFFRLGHDFPAEDSPAERSGPDGDTSDGDALAVLSLGKTESEIIVPVVSAACRLAQSAARGSAALVALRRQQETERATRAAVDTSQSVLEKLLRKDNAGHVLFSEAKGHATEEEEAGEEEQEAEMLRRRIRRETARLAPGSLASAESAVIASDSEQQQQQEQFSEKVRRQRERVERVRNAQAVLDAVPAWDEALAARRSAMRAARERLPIYRCRDELLRCIGENAVTIVVGETGSGKTTQLLQYLYARGFARGGGGGGGGCGGGLIGCTQPRRLAAIGVARRVSEEMGVALGALVGYAIHLDDCTTEETRLKFMTDGVLLREIVRDPDVSRYSVIVLDEAHERSVNTDVLLGVLKAAVRRRADLKLIVTSATMDIHKFSRFFGNAPCYEIPGQTYDVDVHYTDVPVEDYVAEAVFRVCQLHTQMPLDGKHDILVFMTGRDDVHGVCELIRRRLREADAALLDTLLVLPCLSEAANAAAGVLDETPHGMRKCVVATNVAETSLTIDGIRYVIDCGFMKTNVFRPRLGMNTLQRYPVSRAQADQRKGRAGRTTEGLCFRLYTNAQMQHEMLASSVPEIQRSSIDSIVLLLKSIGVSRLAEFDFMDPPPPANIKRSMWQLWVLGLLDDNGAITEDGRRALEFPLAPPLAKMLVASAAHGCSVEALRIASMISADPKGLFELPKDREEMARQCHGRFYVNDSDHLTLLNVMTHFIENGESRKWARDHFLHAPTLTRACEVQEELMERMRQLRLPVTSCGPKGLERVRLCVAEGFCLQSARRSGTNWSEYRPMLNAGVTCFLHPSSAVCSRAEMPLYVVYNDLLLTTKEYLVMVTAVESDWLVKASRGVFCNKGAKPFISDKREEASSAISPILTSKTTMGVVVPQRPPPIVKSKSMISSRRRTNI